MHFIKKDIYGWKLNHKPNTFIGGVSATISNKNLLAAKLNIPVSKIKSFRIVNDEVQANIIIEYQILSDAFLNDINITKYIDVDNKVFLINNGSFRGCPSIGLTVSFCCI